MAAVCEVDSERLAKGVAETEKATGTRPAAVADLRTILDDPSIDAISIAAPNFWHTPATVMACAAGKHVYVEKPGSYCAREAELIVAAAARHDRLVQMGAQRRSLPLIREAIDRLRAGDIGTLRTARCFYNNKRGSIGRGQTAPVPDNLDFDLWQVAAPPGLTKTISSTTTGTGTGIGATASSATTAFTPSTWRAGGSASASPIDRLPRRALPLRRRPRNARHRRRLLRLW